ncbi:MAG TPA: ATP-binding cassette domain-containing protein, partial [bacterium]|nr:ATP-binding cassette domain-containing protein [bacterium]
MIEIQDLRYSYGERQVLQGLTFQVPKGKIFGFLGPNGSGKTTLFRILSTSFPPASGKVTISGFQIPKDYDEVRKRIGVVFQSPSLDAKLTVRENLMHQGHLYGLRGRELALRMEEMMGRLGILDRANERVDKLSGGLKRRA